MRAICGALATAVLIAAASACGSNDKQSQPNTEAGLKQAAQVSFTALVKGDAEAGYAIYSNACRAKTSYAEFAATYIAANDMFERFLGVRVSNLKITGIRTRNVGDGKGEALVLIGSRSDPSLDLNGNSDKFDAWAYEDGRWVRTDCSDMPTPPIALSGGGM